MNQVTTLFPSIREIYIFGSRRFSTGSVRSDVDILLVTSNDSVDYHLPKQLRQLEPYIDAFQVIGGTAMSFANHSQIVATSREALIGKVDAELIWSSDKGWNGNERFQHFEVLSGAIPDYTVARLEPGVIDPARCIADVVVLTALQKEFSAVCNRLTSVPNTKRTFLDEGQLFEHVYADGNGSRTVVVRATRMGPVASALQTILAIDTWSPKLVILTGITAGIASEGVRLGDIVIPDRIVEYEAVKVTDTGEGFHGIIPAPSAAHARRIQQWTRLNSWLQGQGSKLPDRREAIVLHTDAMASGLKVVASESMLSKLGDISRKVCAVEMEAIGVAEACTVLPSPTPYLVIKAVTDLGNSVKDDRYHAVACEAAADMIAQLIEDRQLT